MIKYDVKLDGVEENSSHKKLLSRITPDSRVLELGCATGYLAEYLSQQKNCSVVGVDYDVEALTLAKRFCLQTHAADLDLPDWAVPLEGQTFDWIVCADVLEHLKNPARLLKSLQPLCHPATRLLISIPNVAHASIRLELLQGRFDYEKLGLLDETHLHFYTRESLLNLLLQGGFVAYDIDYTVHDLADEAIVDHLAALGLEPSAQTLQAFHQPAATAYQLLVEARPAHDDALARPIPPLPLKPLASSNLAYGQKQQAIQHLQLHNEQLQNHNEQLQNHNEQLQKELKAVYASLEQVKREGLDAKTHQDNLKAELKAVYAALEQEQREKQNLAIHNENRQQHINSLNHHIQTLERASADHQALQQQYAQLQAAHAQLQAVLDRIHQKWFIRGYNRLKQIAGIGRPAHANPLQALATPSQQPDVNDYATWVSRYGALTPEQQAVMTDELAQSCDWPDIALLMPVYNTDLAFLREALDSVLAQFYPHWRLYIADDASSDTAVHALLRGYQQRDERICVLFRDQNGHISAASNTALAVVDNEFVALMDHDDRLAPEALYCLAKAIKAHPQAALWYSDEDKITPEGERFAPYFKPDWNPELFWAHNYISHLACYRTAKLRELGGFRSAYDGAQDYDLTLRYIETLAPEQIIHIPRVLYHWRAVAGSTATGVEAKPYAVTAMIDAVADALARRHIAAEVSAHPDLPGALRVRYALPEPVPKVSLIIPTRNGYRLLSQCIDSLVALTDYPDYEIIIVDNGSDDALTLGYLKQLAQRPAIKVVRDDSPFNYAALNNRAAQLAEGTVLGLLNNDLEVVEADWLKEMVALAVRPDTGAVGAKLWYPDDTVQHGGVIVGLGGVAGHAHKHFPKQHPGYCGRLLLTQNLAAVTAACLLVRKSVFTEVGGFEQQHLAVAFNDVDLCLRISEAGYRNVWTPFARLYHHESATRGYEDNPEKQARFQGEIDYMRQRWGQGLLLDPAYNPNLTLDREDFSLAWPPR
ncbi:MAG: glycosyltransferase [Methylococcales bacterium]|nr:glycosyltransferase [Methylococcales bacterium]